MADIVSERYAQSLYEVAKDEKQEKEYLEELTAVCGAFRENPDFLKLLTTPSIAFEDKQNVLKTVFEGKIRPFVLNFLMLTTEKNAYVDALLRELARFAPDAPLRPDTVYFGGGTPSLLSPAQVGRLIRAACPVSGAEVTLEANPETVTEESLRGFREAGVNRISFGVQSARDTQLRTLGRPHTARQARAAFAAARRAGFENISGDIMLALPHYTQAEFDETLELIEEGGATHISAYLLKIEPDSAFGRTPPEGLPTGDEAADFYLYAVEQLEHHGYRQYEISNFAKPGYEGRHNLIYWDCGDYLGLGPAAHSCMGGKRFYYPADTAAFLRDNAAPVMDGGCGAEDYLILQLRLRKGLSLPQYKALYGKEFSPVQLAFIRNCVKNGYAAFDGTTLALTPAGLIVQNSILAELL